MYIRLDSVEKVKEFVKLIENKEAEADLISGGGRKVPAWNLQPGSYETDSGSHFKRFVNR